MSERIYRLPSGKEVHEDEISSHTLCEVCGAPAEQGGESYYPANHFSVHPPHGTDGEILEICASCLKQGFDYDGVSVDE